ncbi:MAG TPA: DUF924 family protein [Rhizomicrobium sp.]|jgi:uncharacterized protein (DUF924 family)|nr:DUF924 family protein [Rhizomicrobium sp.]
MSSAPPDPAVWIPQVLHFWFEQLSPEDWFAGKPELDDIIWDRFGDLRQDLKANPPDPADLDGRGHVAAVIVFDQFSRNMFRRSPEAFATDALALALAEDAIARNLDLALHPREQHMLYMPFMHAEDRGLQEKSVALFARLGVPGLLPFAEQHRAVIDRFGRFPHRNKALKRESTPEEIAFLNAKP